MVTGTHMIVLPGGGYAAHAGNEAEPIANWLSGLGIQASMFRGRAGCPRRAPRGPRICPWAAQSRLGGRRWGRLGLAEGAGDTATWTTGRVVDTRTHMSLRQPESVMAAGKAAGCGAPAATGRLISIEEAVDERFRAAVVESPGQEDDPVDDRGDNVVDHVVAADWAVRPGRFDQGGGFCPAVAQAV